MEIVILPNTAEVGRLAADQIESLLAGKAHAVLGLATGSSPLPIYRELEQRYQSGTVSFARARAFTLDEYVGLPDGHPEQYREVIRKEFTDKVDFDPANVHGPAGNAAGTHYACQAYEKAVQAAGGVDLQILGIGTDGHIGFNEPGSSLASRTRIKTLTEQTRRDNARFFDSLDEVPRHVVTQGLGTILEASHILLAATGANKAQAVRHLVEGPVSALCPASALQLHPHVTVLLDDAAASQLSLADYYRHSFRHKPDWQKL
ncbi:glucosamine-6-phosphate deaminase [Paenarthrobacter nitroguajacolicus]|uniref:glucosamine-6-phosphate deaminase n=1 Tax=Paenarthrobacter nitroguajacolicus TaxID=211146 RepID=UPI00248C16FA|nr:glucosamine-6-phosphate deaminase [Paenarthrobacter nitroguajacolicus]MDI2033395.1 Glucosamine-6-phosphate deaminase [Paenarthrobacter nitroguajacolicus]